MARDGRDTGFHYHHVSPSPPYTITRAELKNAAKEKHARLEENTVGGASEILAIRNERALKMKQKKAKQKRKIYGKVKVFFYLARKIVKLPGDSLCKPQSTILTLYLYPNPTLGLRHHGPEEPHPSLPDHYRQG